MLPLPPPPPQPRQREETPPRRPWTPVSLYELVVPKQPRRPRTPLGLKLDPEAAQLRKEGIIRNLRQHRTNPVVWCVAILCLIFCLILIFSGIAILIVYLAIKPRNPVFDTPNASLNGIYFDTPELFNGDFTFLANFSNPNRKIDVRFENAAVGLYFLDRLIAVQGIQPFYQRRGGSRVEPVHMISSLVYLPQNLAAQLKYQVQNNRVTYIIRGNFKVRANLGKIKFSYKLHAKCQLEMTGPPIGILLSHSCSTKR